MTLLKAPRKKNAFNYSSSAVWLTDAFPFCPLLRPALLGCPPKHRVSLGSPTGKFSCNQFYRRACCYLQLRISRCWIGSGSVARSPERDAPVAGVEQKIFAFTAFMRVYSHGSAKVALATLSGSGLIWLTSISSRGDAAGAF